MASYLAIPIIESGDDVPIAGNLNLLMLPIVFDQNLNSFLADDESRPAGIVAPT